MKLYKNEMTNAKYADLAVYCNKNGRVIEDKGDYLEAVSPPEETIEQQNEVIRATREQLYVQTSDKLKADYDEAVARGADNTEELKQAWLTSKDEIRKANPYIGGDSDGV